MYTCIYAHIHLYVFTYSPVGKFLIPIEYRALLIQNVGLFYGECRALLVHNMEDSNRGPAVGTSFFSIECMILLIKNVNLF